MPPEASTLAPSIAAAPARARNSLIRRRAQPAGVRSVRVSEALYRLFWVAFACLIAQVVIKSGGRTPESLIGAMLIISASMLPSYVWVCGRVRGLPLFPAFALTNIWTFALPLVSEQRIVLMFPGWNQLVAAFSVSGFLLLGTLVWYLVARRPPRTPPVCWMMHEAYSEPLLLIALACCAVWTVLYSSGLIHLPPSVDSLSRGIQMPIEALSCFVLSYRLGGGKLRGPAKAIFFVSLGLLLLANLPTLLLYVAMSLSGVSLMAYVSSGKRLPWRVGLVAICAFAYLHAGKAEMRNKYWRDDERPGVPLLQSPGFLLDWIKTSWEVVRRSDADDERGESLLDRSSLMHWLLYIQASSPGNIPYLKGATYSVIPRLLVPRFIDPDKPLATEGITILAVHYGIMTREDADSVTVGFGLLNEAYANFGFFGLGGLAILLGAWNGLVAHWSRGMPVLSFRGLFAVAIIYYAIQTEYSATFYATALLQSSVVLLSLTLIFMRPRRVTSVNTSLLD